MCPDSQQCKKFIVMRVGQGPMRTMTRNPWLLSAPRPGFTNVFNEPPSGIAYFNAI